MPKFKHIIIFCTPGLLLLTKTNQKKTKTQEKIVEIIDLSLLTTINVSFWNKLPWCSFRRGVTSPLCGSSSLNKAFNELNKYTIPILNCLNRVPENTSIL